MNFDLDGWLRGEAEQDLEAAEGLRKYIFWGCLGEIARVLLALISLALFIVAVLANSGSFKQSLFVELFFGVLFFLAIPFFVTRASSRGYWPEVLILVASISFGGAAGYTEGFLQSCLLELSVGLLLLLGLEIYAKNFRAIIRAKMNDARKDVLQNHPSTRNK